MTYRQKAERQALLLFAVLAIVALGLWGRATLQSPEEICLRAMTPRIIGAGPGPAGTTIRGGEVVVRTSAPELSADGQEAQVYVSDGCNTAGCTLRRSFGIWTLLPEGWGFWTIAACGDIDYEYVE
jgi:hypothetical protein